MGEGGLLQLAVPYVAVSYTKRKSRRLTFRSRRLGGFSLHWLLSFPFATAAGKPDRLSGSSRMEDYALASSAGAS